MSALARAYARWLDRRRHRRGFYVLLVVGVQHGHGHHRRWRFVDDVFLQPGGEVEMSTVTVSVGHAVTCTLVFLDQNGNPMKSAPAPDTPPAWSDTTSATGTLTASPSGLSASEVAVAEGGDTISVDLKVGGVEFKASVDVVVTSAPQVLTSVGIDTSVA